MTFVPFTAINTPGDPGWIKPGSDEHRRHISPSKVGAILGLSRWESQYRLWHRMKELTPQEPPADKFDLGHDVEPFGANRWRRKNPGWRLSSGEVQFVVDPRHFGFPAMVTLDRRAVRGPWRRVVEFKMARDQYDAEKWGHDLTGDLPPDYWVQVLVAMLFTGWTEHPGHLLAMGPRFGDERLYEVAFDDEAREEAADILDQCRLFWESLQGDEPPDLDRSVATFECIKELHPEIDGSTVQIDPDEALAYATARADFNAAEEALALESNRLLKRMEQAQYADLGDPKKGGIRVARRQRGSKGGVSFVPSKSINPEQVRQLTGGTAA